MTPAIRVVVVNHQGGETTRRALEHVLASRFDGRLDVVLVDNASNDGLATEVRRDLPDVTVIESAENLGFAGGCNLGMRDLRDADFVALVNPDTEVDPDWLPPLVAALDEDPGLGAACPKILFLGAFADITIRSPTRRPGRGDARDLGVRVSGARVDGEDVARRVQWVRGDWGRELGEDPEPEYRWTSGEALVRLPVPGPGAHAELRMAATRRAVVTLVGEAGTVSAEVGPEPTWVAVPTGAGRAIVNNVGTELVADGYAVDLGYLEPDDGRFDVGGEVFAWCGAAVLLRRAYLEDVGLFDERLFLYYEDLELAWRGRGRGWRYRYVPESVVHHLHAASSIEGSARSDHYNERNHLAVLARHGTTGELVRAFARHAAVTASYARRDLLAPLVGGRSPHSRAVRRRLRALGAAVPMVPGMRRSRRSDGQERRST